MQQLNFLTAHIVKMPYKFHCTGIKTVTGVADWNSHWGMFPFKAEKKNTFK